MEQVIKEGGGGPAEPTGVIDTIEDPVGPIEIEV